MRAPVAEREELQQQVKTDVYKRAFSSLKTKRSLSG
jgi:hypothetical protein